MSFSGTKAGTTSAVAVTLIIDTDIDVGNLLVIHLAGFSGSVSSNLLLSGPMNSSFNATWDTTSADLILKAVNSITALSTIEFTISKANGLTLPQSGLKANDTSLSIRGVTSKGVLSATPVMASTPLVPGKPFMPKKVSITNHKLESLSGFLFHPEDLTQFLLVLSRLTYGNHRLRSSKNWKPHGGHIKYFLQHGDPSTFFSTTFSPDFPWSNKYNIDDSLGKSDRDMGSLVKQFIAYTLLANQ